MRIATTVFHVLVDDCGLPCMADYEVEVYAYELNYVCARLRGEACDEVMSKGPIKPHHFVVGSLGPTNREDSIGPSGVEDPSARNVAFDESIHR